MKKFILFIMLIFWLPVTLAQAAPATPEVPIYTYSIPIIKEDQTLNMPHNTVSYWAYIPDGIRLSECILQLHFSYSNTLIDHLSNLTVYVNGVPIETKGIYTLAPAAEGWWAVKIPLANLKTNATNEIQFESKQRSIEGECADIDNPNNWVVLHKDSYLQVGVINYPGSILATFYSLYYDGLIDQDRLSTDFVVPQERSIATLNSLLKLSSAIGSTYPYKTILDYNLYRHPPNKTNRNQVYIGLLSAWLGNTELKLPENSLETDQGFLSIVGPDEGKSHYNTLITGDTETGLAKAVNFISNETLVKQATQDILYLNSSPVDAPKTVLSNETGIYRFSDFGYGDINLAGAFHQSTNLSFTQLQGRQNSKGSYLNIHFAHAQTLISDRSIMTVYINGNPVNSVKLSLANAEEGTLKVTIPEEALLLPVIEVSIESYHYLGLINCDKDYDESAWTVIKADSELVLLPGEVMLQPVLQTFPYFYAHSDDEKADIAVITDESEANELAAVLLATRAGQNGVQSYNWLLCQPDTELKAYSDLNMIFLGSYHNIQLPDKIKDNLAVAPIGDGQLKIKEGITLIPETLQNKVIFQVIRSPWDPLRRIYVILYDQEENLKLLNSVLSDNSLLQDLDGQIALLDSRLKIETQFIAEAKLTPVPKTFASQIYRWEQLTNMPWWGSAILVVLVIVILIYLVHLRKVKNEFKQVGQNMKSEQGFEPTDNQNDSEEPSIPQPEQKKPDEQNNNENK